MLCLLESITAYGKTRIDPVGALALACVVIATLWVRRSRALVPFLLILTMIPSGQRLAIGGLDLSFVRIAILVLWLRIFLRGEHQGLRFRTIDWVVVAFTGVGLITNALLWASVSKTLLQIANSLETAGAYFAFRALCRSPADLRSLAKSFAVIAIASSVFFLVERTTGKNMFSALGGVELNSLVRKGRLRCQGPFVHPIIAGVFWASVLPFVAAPLFERGRSKILYVVGLVAILVIVANTASSTPVGSLAAGFVAAAIYPARKLLPAARLAGFCGVFVLHAVMSKPVWHLISRIDLAGGSTGYHRYRLMDNFIRRWDEWFVWGVPSTHHWGRLMWDITNQFVLAGVRGGIVYLALFCLILYLGFQSVGRSDRMASSRALKAYAWAAGVSLWIHVVSFFGVSYFGTAVQVLYLSLAYIVAIEQIAHATKRRRSAEPSAGRAVVDGHRSDAAAVRPSTA